MLCLCASLSTDGPVFHQTVYSVSEKSRTGYLCTSLCKTFGSLPRFIIFFTRNNKVLQKHCNSLKKIGNYLKSVRILYAICSHSIEPKVLELFVYWPP